MLFQPFPFDSFQKEAKTFEYCLIIELIIWLFEGKGGGGHRESLKQNFIVLSMNLKCTLDANPCLSIYTPTLRHWSLESGSYTLGSEANKNNKSIFNCKKDNFLKSLVVSLLLANTRLFISLFSETQSFFVWFKSIWRWSLLALSFFT